MQQLYLYHKEFALLTTGNLILKNLQQLIEYMAKKVEELEKAYYKQDELNTKLNILNDFWEMYEYDYKTAKIPEPFGLFNSEEEKETLKKNKFLLQELVLSLGNIYTNFHTNIAKNKLPIPAYDIPTFIINYNELYSRAINEYFCTLLGIKPHEIIGTNKNCQEEKDNSSKINETQQLEEPIELGDVEYRGMILKTAIPIEDKSIILGKTLHAYGTAYILPSLIEAFLALKLQSKMIHNCQEKIRNLENEGQISLENYEKEICNAFDLQGKTSRTFLNSKLDMLTKLYEVFVKYGVLERKQDNEMILVQSMNQGRKQITLGSIINNDYSKEVIRPEYLKLITCLFDVQKLNIRNNIMHCNNVSFDYFNIGLTSIMVQLFWDIMKNDILLD